MLADHGHPEIGTIPSAVALRDRETQMASGVGKVLCFTEQRLPFMPRQAAIVEIGARPFSAMSEEADVVVGLFESLDLARDEAVEFVEIGHQVGRQCEIQGALPEFLSFSAAIKVTRKTQVKQGSAQARLRNWMASGGADALVSMPTFHATEKSREQTWT